MTRLASYLATLTIGFAVMGFGPADAQTVFNQGDEETSEAPALPDELSPELIDGLLARMTDGEIRELLRNELVRRADEQAAEAAKGAHTLEEIGTRLNQMAERIDARTTRWQRDIENISSRAPKIEARLAKAQSGVWGMLGAAAAVLFASLVAAFSVARLTAAWRHWLGATQRGSYWDKLVRTVALGLLELLPILAFVVVTRTLAPSLAGWLGPLIDYLWIYQTGVSYSWAFVVFIRRAFAPDAPSIRIAPIEDDLAERLHVLLRTAVQIGAAGWLIGGLLFHFGLGFPPVMVLRAMAGTAVALVLLIGLWRNRAQIQTATALVFGAHPAESALSRIATAAAPSLLAVYIVAAWGYWLAHWLETGQDRLGGPVGTLIIYLVLPIVDRMGRELIQSFIRSETELAERFRQVFYGAWRMLIGFVGILIIAWLWGVSILGLAKGQDAPAWASTSFDIAVTVLIGYLIWRLIRAALHTEKRVSSANEDVDPSSVPAASRLNTLTPLFRNVMLGFLAIVVAMIVLSAVGVDIGPLIASAGIIGIAIGFGAQSLVRDVFSGIFFLIDDAFRVGEYIELDADMRGEVESISIRSLQLRHHRGAVITIPFGELKQITNHNRDWVIYKMPFRMEPDTDPQKFKKLVKEIGKEFLAHPEHGPKFIEPLKSQGVYYVDDDSALVMRVKFKCKPRAQFVLRREIYHRLRAVFAENGMFLARRKVEVVGPDGGPVPEGQRAALPDEVLDTVPAAGVP